MSPSGSHRLDLNAYLRRIDYAGSLEPSPSVLEALHLAHATRIPFENLDILLGRPILLDVDSLQAKLVTGRRGGYCFEQNLLFAAVLDELGFSVKRLAARVRYRTERLLPRTHMLLLVTVGGASWLADVGFGAELLFPVPFGAGQPVRHYARTYRVVEEAEQWALQSLHDSTWMDLYAFTLEPQELVDYELANYYTSTHPDSRFVQTLTVQLPTPESRMILRNREFIVEQGTSVTSHMLAHESELLDLLAGTFGLYFPSGTRFHYREVVTS